MTGTADRALGHSVASTGWKASVAVRSATILAISAPRRRGGRHPATDTGRATPETGGSPAETARSSAGAALATGAGPPGTGARAAGGDGDQHLVTLVQPRGDLGVDAVGVTRLQGCGDLLITVRL